MDSLTQALLGATTFALIKDKEIGKKSLLIGAIAGTIPDLDVFLSPFFNEVAFLTVHRSVSHSVGLAVILSIFLGWIFYKKMGKQSSVYSWMWAFFLAIMTHSLLDWCTTYGTKLMSPFHGHLFSTNNIHVLEPTYTLILLIGCLLLLFTKSINRQKVINNTLLFSSLFICWTFVSKGIANNRFVAEMDRQGIEYEKMMVSPTPLNSLLWHGIIKTTNGYYFGTYSLFDRRDHIEFYFKESKNEILERISENKLVRYYLDYTQGFPLINQDENGSVSIYAVKYGPINYFGEPEFVYPLTFDESHLQDNQVSIDYSGTQRGPVKSWRKLFQRIKGI